MDGSAPVSSAVAPVSAPASPAPSGGQPPPSAPATPPAPGGAPGSPPSAAGATAAEKAARFLHKHRLADGTEIDVDLSGYKHRTKIDGKDVELDLREMERGYGLNTAAFKRFEEAANVKKQAEAQMAQLERTRQALRDPDVVVAHLEKLMGPKFDQWLESRLVERVRLEKMSPQQREQWEADKRRGLDVRTREQQIAQREQAIAKREQAEKAARAQATLAKWKAQWPNDFAEMGLPNEPAVMSQATNHALELLTRARRLNAPMTIRDAQEQAAEHVRGILAASAKYAAQTASAALAQQPGRQSPTEQPTTPVRRPDTAPKASGYDAVLAKLAGR